jgi:hypothetical protein
MSLRAKRGNLILEVADSFTKKYNINKLIYYKFFNDIKFATEIGKQIVYRAMLLRKGAISVAREAYARKDRISV